MRRNLFLLAILLIVLCSDSIFSQNYWTVSQLGISGTNYDIGRDNHGNVHIIWLNGEELYYGRIENGVVVGRETIPRAGTSVHTRFVRPRLGVRPDGATIHTTWINYQNSGGKTLRHAWRDAAGTWHNEEAWSNNGGTYYIAYPSVGADLNGIVHVIAQRWSKYGTWYTIYGRRYGGVWSWYTLTSGNWRQQVSFTDKNGGFHATWRSLGNPGQYRYCPSGGNLANSATLSVPIVPGTNTPSMGDLFVTDNGDVHNAFISFPNAQVDYYVKRAGSNTFGELSHPSSGSYRICNDYDSWPSVIADDSGQVVVVYGEQTDCSVNGFNVVTLAYSQNGTWQRYIVDANAYILEDSKPALTVANNVGYLVWRSNTGQLLLARSAVAETPTIKVISPNGGESWEQGSSHNIIWTTTGTVGNVKIQYSLDNGSTWTTITSSTTNDGSYSWKVPAVASTQCKIKISESSDGNPTDSSNAVFTITESGNGGGEGASIQLNRTKLYFTATSANSTTGPQDVWISNSGTGSMSWTVSDDSSWISISPASGTNSGVITISINTSGLQVGTYISTVSIKSEDAANSPKTITTTLTVKSASQDLLPFGEFATPTDNAAVQSSIPVTGWVLDDVEVKNVKIYNGTDLIGEAVFVEGARPDIEQAYPNYPKNYRAGWGYMLLTYYLPNGGNGQYTLHAKAEDISGQVVSLGSKTITVDNASAQKPFGAIDTPIQGGSATGRNFPNWGWVLTPQPNKIPVDGSTIKVYVDGVNLGNPTYNKYRKDIAGLFPGYANSEGAVGLFYLDTTEYENGIHTIQWTATDNAGNNDGIGSRYFTILNTSSDQSTSMDTSQSQDFIDRYPEQNHQGKPIKIKKGYNENIEPKELLPNENGLLIVDSKELQRLEIHLGTPGWTGYQVVGSQTRKLPIGSKLDSNKGIFYWQPGAGFLGTFELIFINNNESGDIEYKHITINILPL